MRALKRESTLLIFSFRYLQNFIIITLCRKHFNLIFDFKLDFERKRLIYTKFLNIIISPKF